MIDENQIGALEIRQRYPNPVEDVFTAWSDPSHVKPWWGPSDFTAKEFECDFRKGGAWHAIIVGQDGKPWKQSGQYTRIEPNRIIAFTFKWDDADSPKTDITVEFAAEGDATLVTFRQAPFSSDESRRSHEGGWRECLDRLAEHLKGAGK